MGVFRYLGRLLTPKSSQTLRRPAATAHPLAGALLLCRTHRVPALCLGPFRLALSDETNPCIGQGCCYVEATPEDVLAVTGWEEEKLISAVYDLLREMSGGQLPQLGRHLEAYARDRFGLGAECLTSTRTQVQKT